MAKSRIIKDIANGSVDTITALKRTKVLISDLKNKQVMEWIDHEISGYPANTAVPSYRRIRGNLVGSYFKGSMVSHITYNNVSLPLGRMPEEVKEKFLNVEFHEGVDALRRLSESSGEAGSEISKVIPADYFVHIANYNDDPYMIITSARVIIGNHTINNIFSIIENKLLDILLTLEAEFGPLDELDIDITTRSEEDIEDISKRILVLVYNDNRISIGDGNKIKDATIASDVK